MSIYCLVICASVNIYMCVYVYIYVYIYIYIGARETVHGRDVKAETIDIDPEITAALRELDVRQEFVEK